MSNTGLYNKDNYVAARPVHHADERRAPGAFIYKTRKE